MPQTRRQQQRSPVAAHDSVSLSYVLEDHVSDVTSMPPPIVITQTVNSELIAHRNALKDQLDVLLEQVASIKKQMELTSNDKVTKEAKRMYYHEYKTHPDLISHIRATVGDSNLPTNAQGKIVIPYQLLRKGTDESFDTKIDEQTREVFRQRAMQAIAKKVQARR